MTTGARATRSTSAVVSNGMPIVSRLFSTAVTSFASFEENARMTTEVGNGGGAPVLSTAKAASGQARFIARIFPLQDFPQAPASPATSQEAAATPRASLLKCGTPAD